MPYDIHIVRTRDWTEAGRAPVTQQDVEDLIAGDPELAWSSSDYVDRLDDAGLVTRYYGITWRGETCFFWCVDEITCSRPDYGHIVKLVRIARALNAYAVGDDGERYEIKAGWFGQDILDITSED
jgi:hypothetical protein